jgi:hypothetical protein
VKERTSGPDFLVRTGLVALVTGVLIGLWVAWHWGWRSGAGFTAAVLWSLANFAVLSALLREITNRDGIRKGRVAAWAALKIVGLYGFGAWILYQQWFPLIAVMAGFTWPLAVVLLRSLGAIWWSKSGAGDGPASG